jgi:hypothetical protein
MPIIIEQVNKIKNDPLNRGKRVALPTKVGQRIGKK